MGRRGNSIYIFMFRHSGTSHSAPWGVASECASRRSSKAPIISGGGGGLGAEVGGDRGSPKTRYEFSGVHGRGASKRGVSRTIRRLRRHLNFQFSNSFLFYNDFLPFQDHPVRRAFICCHIAGFQIQPYPAVSVPGREFQNVSVAVIIRIQ